VEIKRQDDRKLNGREINYFQIWTILRAMCCTVLNGFRYTVNCSDGREFFFIGVSRPICVGEDYVEVMRERFMGTVPKYASNFTLYEKRDEKA
jgi:hypothetical protein